MLEALEIGIALRMMMRRRMMMMMGVMMMMMMMMKMMTTGCHGEHVSGERVKVAPLLQVPRDEGVHDVTTRLAARMATQETTR